MFSETINKLQEAALKTTDTNVELLANMGGERTIDLEKIAQAIEVGRKFDQNFYKTYQGKNQRSVNQFGEGAELKGIKIDIRNFNDHEIELMKMATANTFVIEEGKSGKKEMFCATDISYGPDTRVELIDAGRNLGGGLMDMGAGAGASILVPALLVFGGPGVLLAPGGSFFKDFFSGPLAVGVGLYLATKGVFDGTKVIGAEVLDKIADRKRDAKDGCEFDKLLTSVKMTAESMTPEDHEKMGREIRAAEVANRFAALTVSMLPEIEEHGMHKSIGPPQESARYVGKVIMITPSNFVQDVGGGRGIRHELKNFDLGNPENMPILGAMLDVQYKNFRMVDCENISKDGQEVNRVAEGRGR